MTKKFKIREEINVATKQDRLREFKKALERLLKIYGEARKEEEVDVFEIELTLH